MSGVHFDDDVTVSSGKACQFSDVTIDGNLVLDREERVTMTRGEVDGNVRDSLLGARTRGCRVRDTEASRHLSLHASVRSDSEWCRRS